MNTVEIDFGVNELDGNVYVIELTTIGEAAVFVDTKNKRIKNLNQTLKKVLLKSFQDDTFYKIEIESSKLEMLEEEPKKVIIDAFENFNSLYSETALQ